MSRKTKSPPAPPAEPVPASRQSEAPAGRKSAFPFQPGEAYPGKDPVSVSLQGEAPDRAEPAPGRGEPPRKDVMPTGEEIRAAFAHRDERETPREEKRHQRKRENPLGSLEKNTFTMSLVVTLLGLICLPGVERNGSTWYVLMIVFALNGALLVWILARILLRLRASRSKRN